MKGLFIGFNTIDSQFLINKFPGQNEKIKANQFGLYTGGPATNAAITFSHLGGDTSLISSIGQHTFTEFILTELEEYRVKVIDLIPKKKCKPLFSSIVTIEGTGDRTIFSYQPDDRKNCEISLDSIWVNDFDIILTDSFYIESAVKLFDGIKSNIPIIMDAGSWKPDHKKLLTFIDIAICSSDFFPPGTSSIDEVIDFLSMYGIKKIVITRGDKSVFIKEDDNFYEIPVPVVKVVDTLAAGDVFHGAFCYQYAKEKNLKRSVIFAAEIASKSCMKFGTREWMNF